jgi:DNA-binding protein
MMEQSKSKGSTDKSDQTPFLVSNKPVMETALELFELLANTDEIRIRGKGETCPNTVSAANIITEQMLKGKTKIGKIIVDSYITNDNYMISIIDIVIKKIN